MSEELYPNIFIYRRIVQAKLYIDAHYARPLEVNDIAGAAYSSQFHFIRQFKETYGKTPHQYLMQVRIAKAKQLFATGARVAQVCHAVGFESLGSFSALFKRLEGSTPSEYLRKHRLARSRMKDSPLSFIPACFAHKYGII
ncbi:helix-turn-helix domain-containing protein [Puia sp. P3]|uniref:helix-turn-helix domain-containing protein n=1 Tax=Puia sp. P3 TaxID=3423952 RepID=UPI003D66A02D